MTIDQMNELTGMLRGVDEELLLVLLMTQLSQNQGYDYEKAKLTVEDFLKQVEQLGKS